MFLSGRFKTVFVVGLMISVCAWTMAFVFSALAGETPNGTLKKANAALNKNERIVSEQKVADISGIDKIQIESSSQDIRVVTGDEKQVRVEFHGRTSVQDPVEVTTEGSRLTIKLRKKLDESWKWNVSFDSDNDAPLVGLKVTIPREYDKAIAVTTGSGDIRVDKLKVGELTVSGSSGNIRVVESEVQKAHIKTVSGDIEAQKIAGMLQVAAVSGDIEIEEFNGTELKVASVSGDIELEGFSARNVTGGTTSGDIRARPTTVEGWRFDLSTTSGDTSNALNEDANGTKFMRFATTSGDIQIIR